MRTRKNPVTVPVTDALILVAVGTVVGVVGYFLYNRSQAAAADVLPGAIPTGTDVAGSATYAIPPSAATGGVGIFVNQTPGALGPADVSSGTRG
jgi:hypothetical protein